MNFVNVLSRIMGFLVIIITLALAPTIYTNNSNIISANLTNLIGMSAIASFGAFIMIFGLLISGGMFTVAGLRGETSGLGIQDILAVVGSTILVVISLAMFLSVITYVNTLIASAVTASDTIGQTGFGVIPIIIYVIIMGGAGWLHAHTYRKAKRKKAAMKATQKAGFIK